MSAPFTEFKTDRHEHFASLMVVALQLQALGDRPSGLMDKLAHHARVHLSPNERVLLAAAFISAADDNDREALLDAALGTQEEWPFPIDRETFRAAAEEYRRQRNRGRA